jgi:hypothetical protein
MPFQQKEKTRFYVVDRTRQGGIKGFFLVVLGPPFRSPYRVTVCVYHL